MYRRGGGEVVGYAESSGPSACCIVRLALKFSLFLSKRPGRRSGIFRLFNCGSMAGGPRLHELCWVGIWFGDALV